jgi:hypothetical protein
MNAMVLIDLLDLRRNPVRQSHRGTFGCASRGLDSDLDVPAVEDFDSSPAEGTWHASAVS